MKKLIAVVSILAASGCASITNGTNQTMAFEVPSDQVCLLNTVEKNIASVQSSNSEVEVERDNNPVTLHCPTFTKQYTPEISAAGWTSILLIDFGAVDYATGAIWEYKEKESE